MNKIKAKVLLWLLNKFTEPEQELFKINDVVITTIPTGGLESPVAPQFDGVGFIAGSYKVKGNTIYFISEKPVKCKNGGYLKKINLEDYPRWAEELGVPINKK